MLERLRKWLKGPPALIDLPLDSDIRVQRRDMEPGHERIVVDIFTKIRGRFPSKAR